MTPTEQHAPPTPPAGWMEFAEQAAANGYRATMKIVTGGTDSSSASSTGVGFDNRGDDLEHDIDTTAPTASIEGVNASGGDTESGFQGAALIPNTSPTTLAIAGVVILILSGGALWLRAFRVAIGGAALGISLIAVWLYPPLIFLALAAAAAAVVLFVLSDRERASLKSTLGNVAVQVEHAIKDDEPASAIKEQMKRARTEADRKNIRRAKKANAARIVS